jgi:hypothetical protein
MNACRAFALALDPALLLEAQGLTPDSWQRELLLSRAPHLLLNCSRQSGKSTTVAALALHRLLFTPKALVLLVAPSERQSRELFRKVLAGYRALGRPLRTVIANQHTLELANGARLVALPGREDTVRSFSGVRLLLLDEAARVPDELYRAVRPMLAVSRGQLVALSTPLGRRGWFYEEWAGTGPWRRVHIPWTQCPRIRPEFIADETRALGAAWVDQEYNCVFTALEGLVYPDFERAIVSDLPDRLRLGAGAESSGTCGSSDASAKRQAADVQHVGGIDFGWRNPFAAVWGALDRDDVLWIAGERYLRETPVAEHAAALPRRVTWYADPAGATEIEELRRANLVVRRGDNHLRRGIGLVTARLRTGRLKVLASCTNLIAEARLYRWPTAHERAADGENPIDAHNHALAALRYLVTRLSNATTSVAAPSTAPRERDADERWWHPL